MGRLLGSGAGSQVHLQAGVTIRCRPLPSRLRASPLAGPGGHLAAAIGYSRLGWSL